MLLVDMRYILHADDCGMTLIELLVALTLVNRMGRETAIVDMVGRMRIE